MKKRKMYFKMVLQAILRRKSRMFVALLAIVVGGMTVFGLLSIYQDMPRQLSKEFRNYGANLIFTSASEENQLNQADQQLIEKILKEQSVVGITGFRYQTARMNQQAMTLAGTNFQAVQKTSPYWLIEGEWPKKPTEVLVGKEIAEKFQLKIGDTFEVLIPLNEKTSRTQPLIVAGILETGGAEEQMVYLDLALLEKVTEKSGFVQILETSIEANPEGLKQISQKIAQASQQQITPQVVNKVVKSEATVISKLKALIFIVNVVVLLLTMICVGTTMMAVVMERKQEIGLKKALGAENSDIIREFLGEAFILGFVGGVVGIFFGYLFAQLVSLKVFSRQLDFSYNLVPITVIVAILITVIASIIPVRGTIKIEPAKVLKEDE